MHMSVLILGVDYTHGVLKLLCISEQEHWVIYVLCANHGSRQSMDCAAQSMDPCFARAIWIIQEIKKISIEIKRM